MFGEVYEDILTKMNPYTFWGAQLSILTKVHPISFGEKVIYWDAPTFWRSMIIF